MCAWWWCKQDEESESEDEESDDANRKKKKMPSLVTKSQRNKRSRHKQMELEHQQRRHEKSIIKQINTYVHQSTSRFESGESHIYVLVVDAYAFGENAARRTFCKISSATKSPRSRSKS